MVGFREERTRAPKVRSEIIQYEEQKEKIEERMNRTSETGRTATRISRYI